ncbi:phasin family protein [Pseudoduganella chitinolytica]|uniref:Phasin family protein n=1 Tax=Pseudoduganella chitinolytica TaxID=34070 RepID=A0ABY8B7D3_9BURK|nr:phasin family protein [Pseudoduganella chitinolytica]WEF31844.1 phasin family protein [Pseudoduganella chitinolytica]
MITLPAELFHVTRTVLETQLAGCNALARTAFDSGAGLFDVNVNLARDHLAAATAASNKLLFVRDPQDLIGLAAVHSHQALNRVHAYGRGMAGVASDLHTRLGELGKDFAGTLSRTSIE